ncbi:TolC family protein [Leeuwenhoekiella marinoflava]|uniref:Cobalt-zinc-cadmium efflux system outer membrane protein n=2 Tax=Leeuwenhoekiella marinoflava TaxID=988 RepID=A0A4V1KSJ7_9FLAO|nr:TolC family protein [Leeuwenhoekiella marinoflava]RXG31978.1 cobalt-zinc-cadmium efflux system outer membrane protein [Leeuwenhoekiella marinoflava]SHE93643.1 outer membrane protein, cobalt-zinc-cadmium efflux system [Leeuwenhoekiella marinoflava DSM 3653]
MNLNNCRFFLLLLLPFASFCQENGKLVLSLEEAETIFLRENLQLLAERLEIPKAEAEKLQAKVWPNPSLEIDEVNLWTTAYQKRTGEQLPGLFGSDSFGRFRQISAQISQLFETAGKRRKRMELADVSAEMAQSYLEDFLSSLKTEFRKTVFSFHFHERYSDMLERQLTSLENIVNAYQHQYDAGNVNKAELIRLQASLFSIKDDLIEERKTINKLTKELVVLLNFPDNTPLSFRDVYSTDFKYQLPFNYTLDYLQEQAILNRPDLIYSKLEVKHSQKELALEKARAVPDVEFSVGYDRGGNILQDFIGVGASIDLPFFDRNKGNIKKAERAVEQQNFLNQNKLLEVKEEVRQHYKNVLEAAGFFETINVEYTQDLDTVMNAYTEYFKLQSINIITYMDFLESYIDTKKTILENQQEYLDDLEDLKYSTGIEIENP